VAAQVGLNVPVLGNNPVYAPGLLQSPAGPALKANMIVASPVPTFDQQQQLLKDYTAKNPGVTPSLGAVHGYADALVMSKILEKACSNGDLTPEGVTKAKQSLKDVDTQNLVVPLDYSKKGSPSNQSYILQPADGPGGAKQLQGATEAADVKGLNNG
jgi:hypothetical protein